MKKHLAFKRGIIPLALLSSGVLSVLAPAAHAQIERTLEFIPPSVEFGVIREEDGKVSRSVKAVNISQDSTFIISARTSCGCSAAEYSEEMLAPGDTTEVIITYDPTNRPGKFLKTAKFFTGEERIGNHIKLNGTVIPSRKNLDMAYPETAGPLRLSTRIVVAGEVSRSDARPLFVGIYNNTESPVVLAADAEYPLEAALMPDTIEPFGVATLSLMLKGRNIPQRTNDHIYESHLINQVSCDTNTNIPVDGSVKPD